jgi:sodium borate transporter 11
MFGTVIVAQKLWDMRKSVILNGTLRAAFADLALPVAVFTMTLVGAIGFQSISLTSFNSSGSFEFVSPSFDIPAKVVLLALPIGFALSLLFFMDQNVSAALVQTPRNKLEKGTYYHLDIALIGIINIGMSLLGLPWTHGALPHSPLHARALADFDQHIEERTKHATNVVVRARETRLPVLVAHILVFLSLFLLPSPLKYIPKPVLYGLFLCMAIDALQDNSFWTRIKLFVTKPSSFPSVFVSEHLPHRILHKYTAVQAVCLGLLCAIGFFPNPYVQMIFPVLLVLLIVVRRRLLPRFFTERQLALLDGGSASEDETEALLIQHDSDNEEVTVTTSGL